MKLLHWILNWMMGVVPDHGYFENPAKKVVPQSNKDYWDNRWSF